MTNRWFRVGAFFMALGVVLGAFGAHALKARLSPEMLEVYRTGIFYHLIHALGLMVIGLANPKTAGRAAALLCTGILLFSGSLYLLALTGIHWLGAITPVGGICFIAGWGVLAFSRS